MKPEAMTPVCDGDCCQIAVTRAYQEMRDKGEPDQFALDAALAVFCWYHPEIMTACASEIVAHWVHDGALH